MLAVKTRRAGLHAAFGTIGTGVLGRIAAVLTTSFIATHYSSGPNAMRIMFLCLAVIPFTTGLAFAKEQACGVYAIEKSGPVKRYEIRIFRKNSQKKQTVLSTPEKIVKATLSPRYWVLAYLTYENKIIYLQDLYTGRRTKVATVNDVDGILNIDEQKLTYKSEKEFIVHRLVNVRERKDLSPPIMCEPVRLSIAGGSKEQTAPVKEREDLSPTAMGEPVRSSITGGSYAWENGQLEFDATFKGEMIALDLATGAHMKVMSGMSKADFKALAEKEGVSFHALSEDEYRVGKDVFVFEKNVLTRTRNTGRDER